MRALLTSLSVILVVLFSFPAFAEVTVQATVDRNEMEPGDVLVYTVTISATERVNLSHPQIPRMESFSIINEWSSEDVRSQMIVTAQGRREFTTVRNQNFNFQLQPRAEGVLRIPAAQVEVDGKTYTTKPITVKVVKGVNPGQRPRNQNVPSNPGLPPDIFEDDEDLDPFAQLLRRRMLPNPGGGTFGSQPFNPNEAFHIQVEVDKQDVYVSEQVTASWYLYTKGNIRDIDTLKYPSLKGFWKEDIEMATQLNFTEEIINGVPYRKALLASFALFPIKAGTAVIDSYTAKCSVLVGDVFGLGAKVYQFTKSSPVVKIKVKDLPTEGRPSDFTGAVGEFRVTAGIDSQNITANQPFILKIRFDGAGNAKLIDIPPFQPPEGLELYDTQKDAKFFKAGTSYKEFSLSIIPRREGEFTIPPISTSVFDPVAKRYVAKSTDPITINVGKGQAGSVAASPLVSGGSNKPAREITLPPIAAQWKASRQTNLSQQLSIYTGMLCLVSIGLLLHARREFGWGNRKKDLTRKLNDRMRKVRALLAKDEWRAVGAEVTNTCSLILGEIAGERGADVELQKLFHKMPPSLRQELALPVSKLMDKFQALTFAPAEIIGSLKEKQNLTPLVDDFEKQMRNAIRLAAFSASASNVEDKIESRT